MQHLTFPVRCCPYVLFRSSTGICELDFKTTEKFNRKISSGTSIVFTGTGEKTDINYTGDQWASSEIKDPSSIVLLACRDSILEPGVPRYLRTRGRPGTIGVMKDCFRGIADYVPVYLPVEP